MPPRDRFFLHEPKVPNLGHVEGVICAIRANSLSPLSSAGRKQPSRTTVRTTQKRSFSPSRALPSFCHSFISQWGAWSAEAAGRVSACKREAGRLLLERDMAKAACMHAKGSYYSSRIALSVAGGQQEKLVSVIQLPSTRR